MHPANDRPTERFLIVGLFVVAVVAHFYLATINWKFGFMNGHEFRQSQTALISYYIDHQNNFSAHYDTPIMGKPWEIPLEYPLYEWCVVLLSRATHLPYFMAARSISLTCFYATLPAMFLLLGHVGLPRVRRFLFLALILATPVYLFYARAFLIDPMAFMFSVWFLTLFIQTMRSRHWLPFLGCTLCGTAAGLIKSLVFMPWVLPAAIYGAHWLWRDVKANAGVKVIGRTLAWGVGTMVLPIATLTWWVRMTDAIKEKHASAYIFTSQSLSHDNYGTFRLSSRIAPEMWKDLLARWTEAIAQPWFVIGMIVAGAVFLPRERWRILACFGLFMFAQLLIPYAYSGQDYYYYICTAFLIFGFGFVLNGVLDAHIPRVAKWIVLLIPFVVMLQAYHDVYFQRQSVKSNGGTGLTAALRDLLPREAVIVVAGADWAPMIPYYSEHRALMIRNGLEHDQEYLARAFSDLKDEPVGALILLGKTRSLTDLVVRASDAFALEQQPAFSWNGEADIYLNKLYYPGVVGLLRGGVAYHGVNVTRSEPQPILISGGEAYPAATMAMAFKMFQPAPSSFTLKFGFGTWDLDGRTVLIAHPDTDIYLPASPASKVLQLVYGIRPEAYEREGDKTNGVEFSAEAEAPDGSRRELFKRHLNPRDKAADRGDQKTRIELKMKPGEQILLKTRPVDNNYAFDWAYWANVTVE